MPQTRLGLHLGVLVCGTASMCISMYWVRGYTVPAVPRAGHLVHILTKSVGVPYILTKSFGVLI